MLPTPAHCWRFVDRRTKLNYRQITRQIPATSPESETFSNKDLASSDRLSFMCYMQTTGMLNDHFVDCFRHREIQRGYKTGSFAE